MGWVRLLLRRMPLTLINCGKGCLCQSISRSRLSSWLAPLSRLVASILVVHIYKSDHLQNLTEFLTHTHSRCQTKGLLLVKQ
ncbi:hypothetical protein ZWY2020_030225 [Hordeum vulgare]|nr:hypothetical protein ZWY2020_030225 [Hordeum vulgare]